MIHIRSNISLKPYNTFGINANSRFWVEINDTTELQELFSDDTWHQIPILVLGGGSNILLIDNFDGLVIKNNIQGIHVIREDEQHFWVSAGAGVNWHQFVMYCVSHNFAGVENLSLIPGTVGAAPMQNIGAYGVEIEQVFESLEALHIQTGQIRSFTHADCQFGYRESIFKKALKGQYIITRVTFRLNKVPIYHTSYGAIQETLNQMGIHNDQLSIKAISDAVIQIRQSKLPDPSIIGNAGSFFKNPEIPFSLYETLKSAYPEIPGYPSTDKHIKVPAGWLIEKSGWKGHRTNDAGVHTKQALVLVNYGNATGSEIIQLAYAIQSSVKERFGIDLSPEVNIVP